MQKLNSCLDGRPAIQFLKQNTHPFGGKVSLSGADRDPHLMQSTVAVVCGSPHHKPSQFVTPNGPNDIIALAYQQLTSWQR